MAIVKLPDAAEVIVDSVAALSRVAAERDFVPIGQPIWFRGHRDASWGLEPKLLRSEIRDREMTMIRDFEIYATDVLGRRVPESWEILCIAQHYGLPTRLLDWTNLAPIALFFATRGTSRTGLSSEDIQTPGAIYALAPERLNDDADYGRRVLTYGRDAVLDDANHELVDSGGRRNPYAVQAPYTFDRIARQEGRFVSCDPRGKALDSLVRDGTLEKWVVPGSAKPAIREELESLGFVESRVFPTLANFAEQVWRQNSRS